MEGLSADSDTRVGGITLNPLEERSPSARPVRGGRQDLSLASSAYPRAEKGRPLCATRGVVKCTTFLTESSTPKRSSFSFRSSPPPSPPSHFCSNTYDLANATRPHHNHPLYGKHGLRVILYCCQTGHRVIRVV
jgi:hypothetical protein